MFSFFRKGSTSAAASERAPPPTSQPRRERDSRWFNSTKQPHNQPPAQSTSQSSYTERKSPPAQYSDSIHQSPRSIRNTEGRNAPSGASLRTRGSRLFQLGGSTQKQSDRHKYSAEPHNNTHDSTTYAASAPNPHAPGGRTSPPLPPPLPTQSPSSPLQQNNATDPNTKSLATRLQELATSHADGLLDDEEYRLLRTELFERYAAKSSQPAPPPAAPSLTSLGRSSNGYSASTSALAPPLPPSMASPPSTQNSTARAPSFISTNRRDTRRSSMSGLRSMFRRSSHATLRPDSDGPERDTWEVVDPNSAPTSPSASTHTHATAPTQSPGLAMRTVRHHPALASASLSPSMSYRSSRSSNGYAYTTRAGSSVRSGGSIRSGAGSRAGTSVSMSNGPTLLAPMASSRDPFLLAAAEREPTSKELKEEIAEIERERQRLEESWKTLEKAAVAKYGEADGHGAPQAEGGEPTIQLRPPTAEGGGNGTNRRMSTLMRKASYTRRPLSQVAESPTFPTSPARSPHQSTTSRLGQGSRLSPRQGSPSSRSGDHSPRQTSPRTSNGSFTGSTSSKLLVMDDRRSDDGESGDVAGLGLEEVRRRRRATDDRYEKRLEFLRARLRGALLREGLKG